MTDFITLLNLETEFLNNKASAWLTAFFIFLAVGVVLKIFKVVIIAKLNKISKQTKNELDDLVIRAINSIHWPFYVLTALYIALKFLDNTSSILEKGIYYIFLAATIYYAIRVVQSFIDFGVKKIIKKRKDENNVGMVKLLGSLAKIFLWVLAILLLLSNLGYNVNSLLAGLGVGGIAVALAVQSILGDIFSSFSIYFDKPFRVGDFIVLGEDKGTVKKIGIKTTRIQTLQGEELIISNNELTKARIQNFGAMDRRRIIFNIGVVYDTPVDKLKIIPEIIKDIISIQENIEVDRVHFKSFGDFSLNYEIVYFFNSPDYNQYLDVQQAINLAIVNKFAEHDINMAFPTQTVYLEK